MSNNSDNVIITITIIMMIEFIKYDKRINYAGSDNNLICK